MLPLREWKGAWGVPARLGASAKLNEGTMSKTSFNLKAALRASTALVGLALAGLATTPANAIVINDAYTPTQVVDTTNITGVGQMVVDEQNGFIGLCTATLINPRTVIFASHCVNETPD